MIDIGSKYPWLVTFVFLILSVSIAYLSYTRYMEKLREEYNLALEEYCKGKLDILAQRRLEFDSYEKPVDDTFLPSRDVYEWHISAEGPSIGKGLTDFERSIMDNFRRLDKAFFVVKKNGNFLACGYAGTVGYGVVEREAMVCDGIRAGVGFANYSKILGRGFNVTEYFGNINVIILSRNDAFYKRLLSKCWK